MLLHPRVQRKYVQYAPHAIFSSPTRSSAAEAQVRGFAAAVEVRSKRAGRQRGDRSVQMSCPQQEAGTTTCSVCVNCRWGGRWWCRWGAAGAEAPAREASSVRAAERGPASPRFFHIAPAAQRLSGAIFTALSERERARALRCYAICWRRQGRQEESSARMRQRIICGLLISTAQLVLRAQSAMRRANAGRYGVAAPSPVMLLPASAAMARRR